MSTPRFDSYADGLNRLVNETTGMGSTGYDPSMAFSFSGGSLSTSNDYYQVLLAEEGLLRKAVQAIPAGCIAYSWGRPEIAEGDDRVIQLLQDELDDIPVFSQIEEFAGVRAGLHEAMTQAFMTGNAALVVEADDGKDLSEPLDVANIKSIEAFHVFDRWNISPELATSFGPPQRYRIMQTTQRKGMLSGYVHSTRVFWLYGLRRSTQGRIYSGGFDKSLLEDLAEAYVYYKSAIQNSGRMLQDFDVMVHKIKDLGKIAAQACKNDPTSLAALDGLKDQLKISHKAKSNFRTYVADMDNEAFDQITRSVGGYRDLADFVKDFLPASCEFPAAILFGEFGNGGLNSGAKSKEEKELFNDVIRNAQNTRLTPIMTGMPSKRRRYTTRPAGILELICLAKNGPLKGKVPKGLTWKWNDLYPQTQEERAATEGAWTGVLGAIASFDPNFTPNYILSRFATPDSPITLTEEYAELLREQAANPQDPNAAQAEEVPPEDQGLTGEQIANEAVDQGTNLTDSADTLFQLDTPIDPEDVHVDAEDPIVANCRKALEQPIPNTGDFSPAALRYAVAIVQGARPTEAQRLAATAWMQSKQRYARYPEGTPERTAWDLRGGDAAFKKMRGELS